MSTFFSPQDILNHFFEYIPRVSDRFSENSIVSADIVAGTPQVLRVTDTSHGFSVGDSVVLFDGEINNPITAVELVPDTSGSYLRFTTENNHDLTEGYTETVKLSGFTDPSFNGTFNLETVPSRTIFEISGDTLPILNGNEVLTEEWEIGIDGLFEIDRVIDLNIYEIDLTGKPYFTPQTVPNLKRASNFRMGIASNAKRAESIYIAPADDSELWLYIIMGDCGASKDKNIVSDAVQQNTSQNTARILLINTFSILVFFSTNTDTVGARASQLAWNEILKVMLTVGSGIKFDDFGNTNYLTALIDHGSSVEKNSYYSHAYTFEYNFEVTQEESFLTQFITSRAFRDNAISFNEIEEGSNINLDSEAT